MMKRRTAIFAAMLGVFVVGASADAGIFGFGGRGGCANGNCAYSTPHYSSYGPIYAAPTYGMSRSPVQPVRPAAAAPQAEKLPTPATTPSPSDVVPPATASPAAPTAAIQPVVVAPRATAAPVYVSRGRVFRRWAR